MKCKTIKVLQIQVDVCQEETSRVYLQTTSVISSHSFFIDGTRFLLGHSATLTLTLHPLYFISYTWVERSGNLIMVHGPSIFGQNCSLTKEML